MTGVRDGWVVVMPVKRLPAAKTRLRGGLPGIAHERLALAIALDTVAAALACPSVRRLLVVTDEPAARIGVVALGAAWTPDLPGAGLNPALSYGAAVAADAAPGLPVAALGADLPALRPEELAAALAAARPLARAFVADTSGAGTSLLTAAPGVPLGPRFGRGSARAHRDSGAVELAGGWPSLRRDVDTAGDLAEAATLGIGRRTAVLMRTATLLE